jgi:hypothetical protein
MDIHFMKTVLLAPSDHPGWETDLLAKLADVPSREVTGAPTTARPGRGGHPLVVAPPAANASGRA